ncbi:MAG: hypothetical protein JSS40_07810 [Proteobacteria bacterium]|nr:hypothetical protein [Pseudomonadota bacterium]
MTESQDKNGARVQVGSKVRVVQIRPSVLAPLPEKDRQNVLSMKDEVFEVYEIDQWGGAWVEKWWYHSDGTAFSHSLGLSADEMEIAE